MEIDNNKFINLVIDKTNKRLNELQAQVIVLESQLQLAGELVKQLQGQAEKQVKKDKSEI